MNPPEESTTPAWLGQLFHPQGRFLARLTAVLRFDPQVFAEIEKDPHAIPQAFAVVIATAVVGSLGQGFPGIFLGIAGAILVWGIGTSLVWGIATLVFGDAGPFPSLLRCMGFAYAWFALLIGANLPFVGSLFSWAAVGLCLAAAVMATRQVLRTSTLRAFTVCAVSFGTPILLLLVAG
jgi:hypothetical protein